MQDTTPPRLTMQHVLQAVSETFSLDRGIFRTLLDLLIRPKTVIETYLFIDRSRYTKPLTRDLTNSRATAQGFESKWQATEVGFCI